MNWGFNLNRIYEWPLLGRLVLFGLIFITILYIGNVWELDSFKVDLATAEQQEVKLKQQLAIQINNEIALRKELLRLPQSKKNLQLIQSKLIQYNDVTELLNQILKIGANNNLYFNLFDPGEETQIRFYNKLPLRIITLGSYDQIANFISQIANMRWIVAIESFSISYADKHDQNSTNGAEKPENPNLLAAEINLEIFRVLDQKELQIKQKPPAADAGSQSPEAIPQPKSNENVH